MDNLPRELLLTIHSFCDAASQISLSFSCKRFSMFKRVSKYDALSVTVESESISLINYFLSMGCIFNGTELGLARKNKIFSHFLRMGCPLTRESLKNIMLTGNVSLVKLILPKISQDTLDDVFYYSVQSGNMKLVRILENRGCSIDKHCLRYAVKSGNITFVRKIIKKLGDMNYYVDIYPSIERAVKLNSVELLDLFEEISGNYASYSMDQLDYSDYMSILALVMKEEDPKIIYRFFGNSTLSSDRGFLSAVKTGKLEIAKDFHLRLESKPKNLDVMNAAIESENSKMFFWLLDEGYNPSQKGLTLEPLYKNAKMLRYFYEKGLIDKPSIFTAISKGNLKTVRYLHEKLEISIVPQMILDAITSKCLETLKYVWERSGSPKIFIVPGEYSDVFDWTLDHCELLDKRLIMKNAILFEYDRKPLLSLHKRGLLCGESLIDLLPNEVKIEFLQWMDRYDYFTETQRLQISYLFNTRKSIYELTNKDIKDSINNYSSDCEDSSSYDDDYM